MSHKVSYYTEIIDALLKNGADPNIKTDDRTLLYLAVHSENVKCVKTLLDAGANPNLRNDEWLLKEGKPVSLIGRWIPREKSSKTLRYS